MLQGRADKTRDKKRRGDLPTPIGHTQLTGQGDGRPCDGCGETIRTTEVRVAVSILGARAVVQRTRSHAQDRRLRFQLLDNDDQVLWL